MKKRKFNIQTKRKIVDSGINLGTFHNYSLWYDKLYEYSNGTNLRKVKFNDLENFMDYLEKEKLYSLSSLHVALASLRFLYNEIYKINYKFEKIKLPQIQREIPYSISKVDIKRLLEYYQNLKHKTVLSLMYSAGLVSSDIPRILVEDIDSGFLRVRDKNLEVKRITPIGEYMKELLRKYYRAYKPKKFLFEGLKNENPYSVTSVRKILQRAVLNLGIEKPITSRHFKYSYVKHLQDEGFKTIDILNHLNSDDPVTIKYYSSIDNETNEIEYSPIDSIYNTSKPSKVQFKITDEQAKNIVFTDEQTKKLIENKPELIKNFIESGLTSTDILNYSYRKNQLLRFNSLLTDADAFKAEMESLQTKSIEGVWQKFFEQNSWIFGHGLNYVFSSPLNNSKLEQIVSGYNFNSFGKRVDGLLKTRGIVSSLCFVEIKTHKTELISTEYRKEAWAISKELNGAIAQVQRTVQKALESLSSKIEVKDEKGYLTGEVVYLHQPKSYVIIGNLNEFVNERGVNENMYSSFEIFRRNIIHPEILTFDELYERAKFIVETQKGHET